jgi:hypothetical protein
MSDKQETQLKPCPFCGHEVEIENEGDNWYVWCDNCDFAIEGFMSASHAKDRWNRRTDTDLLERRLAETSEWTPVLDGEYIGLDKDEHFIIDGDRLSIVKSKISYTDDGRFKAVITLGKRVHLCRRTVAGQSSNADSE